MNDEKQERDGERLIDFSSGRAVGVNGRRRRVLGEGGQSRSVSARGGGGQGGDWMAEENM